MTKLLILIVLAASNGFAFQLKASKLKEHKDKIKKTFKDRPHIQKAILEMVEGSEDYYLAIEKGNYKANGLYGSVDIPDKWVDGKRRYFSGQKCLSFLLTAEKMDIQRSSRAAIMEYKKDRSSKELEQKDHSLMMNRDLRGKVQKGIFNKLKTETYQLCKSKLPQKLVTKKQRIISPSRGKTKFSLEAYLSNMHPHVRDLFKPYKKEIKKGDKSEQAVLSEFLSKVLPLEEKKEKTEFIAGFNKKCPGMLEKVWSKCDGKKFYRSRIYKNLDMANCLRDNKKSIPAKCF